MKCQNCGYELSENALFCIKCGSKYIAPARRQHTTNHTASKILQIHQLSSYYSFGVAVVKESGKVVVYGESGYAKWKRCWEKGLSDWNHIVEVSSSSRHTVGLRDDGTVAAFTGNPYKVEGSEDYEGACKVDCWNNIIQVACGWSHTVGLKSDGTVVAVGDNGDGQCTVEGWRDIVQISAANEATVGIKPNGELVLAGRFYYDITDKGKWSGILGATLINIQADTHIVAIDKNNKIISDSDEIERRCAHWENIVKIYAHFDTVIGIDYTGKLFWTKLSDGEPACKSAFINLYKGRL